jgi:hypothetical protein
MQGLTRRLRALSENVRSLALMDVYGRVARLLLELAVDREGTVHLVICGYLSHFQSIECAPVHPLRFP